MSFDPRYRRGIRALAVAIMVPALAACGSDDPVDDHEDVEFMELTIGAQTIRVATNGDITGGPVEIIAGNAVPVTAQFLDHDGEVITFEPGEYELRGQSVTPEIITFGKTGVFSGALTGTAAGNGVVTFQLFHLVENHEDFEQNVPITVLAAN